MHPSCGRLIVLSKVLFSLKPLVENECLFQIPQMNKNRNSARSQVVGRAGSSQWQQRWQRPQDFRRPIRFQLLSVCVNVDQIVSQIFKEFGLPEQRFLPAFWNYLGMHREYWQAFHEVKKHRHWHPVLCRRIGYGIAQHLLLPQTLQTNWTKKFSKQLSSCCSEQILADGQRSLKKICLFCPRKKVYFSSSEKKIIVFTGKFAIQFRHKEKRRVCNWDWTEVRVAQSQ